MRKVEGHETEWGHRIYLVRGLDSGPIGMTNPSNINIHEQSYSSGVVIASDYCVIDRDAAREMAKLLEHYAETGRLPEIAAKGNE